MNKTRTAAAGLLFCLISSASAGIAFSNPDVSDSDAVLYTVRQTLPGTLSYDSLLSHDVKNTAGAADILTCFPEQLSLISGGTALRIRNRYGTARYAIGPESLAWTEYHSQLPIKSFRAAPETVSPDGKWICFVARNGYTVGNLVIENAATGARFVISERTVYNGRKVPAVWASDSSVLFYEKDGALYFLNPEAIVHGVEADEQYRKIGEGRIASLCTADGCVIYIDGDIVYRIGLKELYTTGLYSGIIGRGNEVGRLPTPFNFETDTFSVDNAVTSLLLISGLKTIEQFRLPRNGSGFLDMLYYRPYVNPQGAVISDMVFWDDAGNPSVWFALMPYSGKVPYACVCKIVKSTLSTALTIDNATAPSVSPDGTRALFFTGSSFLVYDTTSWKCCAELPGEKGVSAVWASSQLVYVGGESTVRSWNISTGTSAVLFLSSAVRGVWNEGSVTAVTKSGQRFKYDMKKRTWSETPDAPVRAASVQNGRYRVFCGKAQNETYENALYIRTLSGKIITRLLYSDCGQKSAPEKQVALAFDVYGSSEGLVHSLWALASYHVFGTFFINGTFIERYPVETKQIAVSGSECASLFFTDADLTSVPFVVDENFIRRGLARTEDEFYQCTGKELSLLWHAPYYKTTDAVKQYAKNAGYEYQDALCSGVICSDSPAEQIASIDTMMAALEKNGGGCIPVVVGRNNSAVYLYDYLDLLMSALLDAGYSIVPVSQLAAN